MFRPHLGGYGFGWVIEEQWGHPVVWHNGGIGGAASHLAHYPEADLTVVVLANVENANADGVACAVAAHFLGEDAPFAARGEPSLPEADLRAYAGTYTTPTGEVRRLTFEEGRLLYRDRIPLVPEAGGALRFERPDHYRLRFETGPGGVEGFAIEGCGRTVLRALRSPAAG